MALPPRKKRDMPMPPPGPPKTVIAIGIGKKPGADVPPDDASDDNTPDMPPDAPIAPPGGAGGAPGPGMNTADDDTGAKVSPDRAIVIRANEHCRDCQHYEPTTGECAKVDGAFDPDDACSRHFLAISDEPDADDMGGAPDADADDAKIGALTQ